MKIGTNEEGNPEGTPLERIVWVLRSKPGEDMHIDDIGAQAGLSGKQIYNAIYGQHRIDSALGRRIKAVLPNQVYRWVPYESMDAEREQPPEPPTPKVMERHKPEPKVETPPKLEIPEPQVKAMPDGLILETVGVTSKGTTLVRDEGGILYVLPQAPMRGNTPVSTLGPVGC